MSFDNGSFLFDKILQQQGGFPVPADSFKTVNRMGIDSIRNRTPSSENGSKSPSNESYEEMNSNTKRRYHNKSRNGCATCKKRRVKCDENHPICAKCDHMKIECVYLPVEPKIRRKKKEILAERAKREHSVDSAETHQGVPSISVDDYDESSRNYTSSVISARDNSIQSILSSQSSPLSSNTIIKHELQQQLPALASLQDEEHQKQQQEHPSLEQKYSIPQIASNGTIPFTQNINRQEELIHQIPKRSSSGIPVTPQQIQKKIQQAQEYQKERVKQFQEYATKSEPNLSPSVTSPSMATGPLNSFTYSGNLNLLDLRLMYHYTTKVWPTITAAGISEERIWSEDIPLLAFNYPFLMHSILAFSATHLSRTERGLDQCVTCHRGDALKLLREAVLEISPENTDALVASALILIMDSLANASTPASSSPKSLPASAWIFHVKGAATILTAVWPLNETSRFYKFIGVDLGDLGDIINSNKENDDEENQHQQHLRPLYSDLQCFDNEIADLYPVPYNSPYLVTLAYLNKLHSERYKSDFILRIFAFPALLDKVFLGLLITGDISAMRIMRSYYTLLRSFTTEMRNKVWFLEGVSNVLPVDVEQYSGGGGMNMMLDFLGGPSTLDVGGDDDLESYSDVGNGLLNPDNLPSSITNNLDVMQGDNDFI